MDEDAPENATKFLHYLGCREKSRGPKTEVPKMLNEQPRKPPEFNKCYFKIVENVLDGLNKFRATLPMWL